MCKQTKTKLWLSSLYLLGYIIFRLLHEPQHNFSSSCLGELLFQFWHDFFDRFSQISNKNTPIAKPPNIDSKECIVSEATLQLEIQNSSSRCLSFCSLKLLYLKAVNLMKACSSLGSRIYLVEVQSLERLLCLLQPLLLSG